MADPHPDDAAAQALAAEAVAAGLPAAAASDLPLKPRDEAGGPPPELAWAVRLDGGLPAVLYRTAAEPRRLVLAWASAQRFDGWYLLYPGGDGFVARKARDFKFRDLVKRAPAAAPGCPAYALSDRIADAIESRTAFVKAAADSGLLVPGCAIHYSTRAGYVFMDARRTPTLEAARALAAAAAPVEAALAGMAAAEAQGPAADARLEGVRHLHGEWMYGASPEPRDGVLAVTGASLVLIAGRRRRATAAEKGGGAAGALTGALLGLARNVAKAEDDVAARDDSKGEIAPAGEEWKFEFRKSAVSAAALDAAGALTLTMIHGEEKLWFRPADASAARAALLAHRYPLPRT